MSILCVCLIHGACRRKSNRPTKLIPNAPQKKKIQSSDMAPLTSPLFLLAGLGVTLRRLADWRQNPTLKLDGVLHFLAEPPSHRCHYLCHPAKRWLRAKCQLYFPPGEVSGGAKRPPCAPMHPA